MKRFSFIVLMVALAGCGDAGTGGGRVALYSTSPGFQPISRDSFEGPPEPGESPEEPPDDPVDGEPQDPSDDLPPPSEEGPVEAALPEGADPFADRVDSFRIGEGGGSNEEDLPDIVLGAPRGAGLYQGSFDVFSLGVGGEIILEFTDFLVFDGEGADFTVFENAFQISGASGPTFSEPGIVGVSENGVDFVEFPCNTSGWPYEGCAGANPVLANAELNDVDPTDPTASGGDSFDLQEVGLDSARFIRIRDSGLGLGPIGPGIRGFDLDAVAVIHGTLP